MNITKTSDLWHPRKHLVLLLECFLRMNTNKTTHSPHFQLKVFHCVSQGVMQCSGKLTAFSHQCHQGRGVKTVQKLQALRLFFFHHLILSVGRNYSSSKGWVFPVCPATTTTVMKENRILPLSILDRRETSAQHCNSAENLVNFEAFVQNLQRLPLSGTCLGISREVFPYAKETHLTSESGLILHVAWYCSECPGLKHSFFRF